MADTILNFTSFPITVSATAFFDADHPYAQPTLETGITGIFELETDSTVDISFPPWIVESEATIQYNHVDISFPAWDVEATGVVGIVASVDISFPTWQVEAANLDLAGNSGVAFPPWRVDARGTVGIVATVDILFPSWEVLAAGHQDIIAAVAIDFPPWIVDVYARSLTLIRYKTPAMNANHYGVTEYMNWNFNSYANLNGKLLAVKGDGLYEAGGDKDGGLDIDSMIFFGITDMHRDIMRTAREAWITVRANGDLVFVMRLDEHTEYEYLLERVVGEQNAHELRAEPGRGINNRFVTFGFKNKSGCYFELDSIKVYADVSDRRIR